MLWSGIVSRKFAFHIPNDNIFGVPGQTTPAVVIGDFVMIRPLKAIELVHRRMFEQLSRP